MNIQAPPNLNPNDHKLLLRSGINDWGGISPVTQDYINPEAAWPQIGTLSKTCEDAALDPAERRDPCGNVDTQDRDGDGVANRQPERGRGAILDRY